MKALLLILPLMIGFGLDYVIGDPNTKLHPVCLIGAMITKLEKALRKTIKNERLAGTLLVFAVLAISAIIPQIALYICYRVNVWIGTILEGVLFCFLISPKCLKTESMKVYRALKRKNTEKAREAVSMIVGRDTENLDEKGIIKAAVETVAENTSDGITAPMLYMAIGGISMAFFYKAANTMDSMIGYKNEKYKKFGRFAARLDDVLNFIPSRLTALIMIAASYFLKLDGKNAFKIWKRDRRNHSSPNSAQTESACAGALGVMLGGDAYYFGELYHKKTIGDDLRPIENYDIPKANKLMYCTSVMMFIICIIIRLLVGRMVL